MASHEDLKRTYFPKITPKIFGNHFNERPQPDALGRTPATPLEIQRAIRGEFYLPPQPPVERLSEQIRKLGYDSKGRPYLRRKDKKR